MSDLKDVKIGDVIYCRNSGQNLYPIRKVPYITFKVERFTKTQLVATNGRGNESRFAIENGRMVGDRYTTAFAPTIEQVSEQKAALALKRAYGRVTAWVNSRIIDRADDFWITLDKAISEYDELHKGEAT